MHRLVASHRLGPELQAFRLDPTPLSRSGRAERMDAVSLDPEAFARHQLTDEEWEAFDRDVRATPARAGDALEQPEMPRAAPGWPGRRRPA